ncbi:MAG: hypothetical protein Q6M04_14550, partial [Thermostichus sp. BF3_bins_97]
MVEPDLVGLTGIPTTHPRQQRYSGVIHGICGVLSMGQEIASLSFSAEDFAEFAAQLQQETDLLARWLAGAPGLDPACQPFAQGSLVGGFELEAWLITAQGEPAPINQAYLEAVNNPLVVPELAQFNVEINSQPQVLTGSA